MTNMHTIGKYNQNLQIFWIVKKHIQFSFVNTKQISFQFYLSLFGLIFLYNSSYLCQGQNDTIFDLKEINVYSKERVKKELEAFTKYSDSTIKVYKEFGTRAKYLPMLDSINDLSLYSEQPDTFFNLFNSGISHFYSYQYESAILDFEKFYISYNTSTDIKRDLYATCLNNIGLCYLKLGDIRKAYHYINECINIRIGTLGKKSIKLISCYNNLGLVYFEDSHYFNALESIFNVFLIDSFSSASNEWVSLFIKSNIATCYQAIKNYEAAYKWYNQCFFVVNPMNGFNHTSYATILYNMATIFHERANPKLCEKYLNIAIKKYEFMDSLNRTNNLDLIKNVYSLKALVYVNYYVLTADSIFLYQSGSYFDAAKSSYNKYSKALKHQNENELSKYLKVLHGQEIKKNYYLYDVTDSMYYWINDFIISENIHHSTLYNYITDLKKADVEILGFEDYKSVRDLKTKISLRQKQIDSLIFIKDMYINGILYENNINLYSVQNLYYQLFKNKDEDINPTDPKAYTSNLSIVSSIQNLLNKNQTFVEYIIHGQIVQAFIINKDTFKGFNLKISGVTNHFDDTALSYIQSLDLSSKVSIGNILLKSNMLDFVNTSTYIYNKFVKPFESLLKREVIIVTDNNLNYIPFETLLPERPSITNDFGSYRYFGDDHIISYALSAKIWIENMKIIDCQTKNSVLAFAPFSSAFKRNINKANYVLNQRDTISLLPESGRELDFIEKMFPGTYLRGKEANMNNFVKLSSQYPIIHLSTHSKSNLRNSLFSWVAFSDSTSKKSNLFDKLYLDDINSFKLKAKLVSLSSCESGIGVFIPGEGVISLSRAFTLAGAQSVLSTMWKVEDKASQHLVTLFYKYLSEGQPKNLALWNAKKEFRKINLDSIFAHPYFWSSFVLFGNIRPI